MRKARSSRGDGGVTYTMLLSQIVKQHTPIPRRGKNVVVSWVFFFLKVTTCFCISNQFKKCATLLLFVKHITQEIERD